MAIELFSPIGIVDILEIQPQHRLDGVSGKRVGYIFNQHSAHLKFWQALEQRFSSRLRPIYEKKIYKPTISSTAHQTDIANLLSETDFAIVGVGA